VKGKVFTPPRRRKKTTPGVPYLIESGFTTGPTDPATKDEGKTTKPEKDQNRFMKKNGERRTDDGEKRGRGLSWKRGNKIITSL